VRVFEGVLIPIPTPAAYGYTLEYVRSTTGETVVEHYASDSDPAEIEARKSELRAAGYVPFHEISS
jgi:hypothetical protein